RFARLGGAANADLLRPGTVSHILDRVINQVLEYLAQARALANECWQRRVGEKFDPTAAQVVLEHAAQLADQLFKVHRLHLLAAGLDAAELEKFGDEISFGLHILLDAFKPADDLVIESLTILHEQHARHATDIPQRRVQIMRDGAEKV